MLKTSNDRQSRTRNTATDLYRKESARIEFERDAETLGFDLARCALGSFEPWAEYQSSDTGHRWAGWLAARGIAP